MVVTRVSILRRALPYGQKSWPARACTSTLPFQATVFLSTTIDILRCKYTVGHIHTHTVRGTSEWFEA
jgi:hypothetical protein